MAGTGIVLRSMPAANFGVKDLPGLISEDYTIVATVCYQARLCENLIREARRNTDYILYILGFDSCVALPPTSSM